MVLKHRPTLDVLANVVLGRADVKNAAEISVMAT